MEMQMVKELILQSLEHERAGVRIYEAALKCAQNGNLKEEWQKYLRETERHVQVLQDVCSQMQLDAEEQTPGRKIVADMGRSFVAAIETALGAGDPALAECVACECVVLAEEKDHSNWQLIDAVAKKMSGAEGRALKEAVEEVEDQEDQHYYHSKGWLRELSMQALGMKAVVPPPEENEHVKTASQGALI